MKTAEEIKKGLEHCCNNAPCLECEYADQRDHRYTCEDALLADALAYIQQLEAAHRTEYCEESDYDCKALGEARKRIAELEAIDAEPVRHGKPVNHYTTYCNSDGKPVTSVWDGYECPFCGSANAENYCPRCGAKMDLEVRDD